MCWIHQSCTVPITACQLLPSSLAATTFMAVLCSSGSVWAKPLQPQTAGREGTTEAPTCHLKPSSGRSEELFPVSICTGKSTGLCLLHTWRVAATELNPSVFPTLPVCSLALQEQSSARGSTDSFFNCNWQSFCSSLCIQTWELSKINRKKSWLFFHKK